MAINQGVGDVRGRRQNERPTFQGSSRRSVGQRSESIKDGVKVAFQAVFHGPRMRGQYLFYGVSLTYVFDAIY